MQDLLLLNEIIYRPIFNLLLVFLQIFQGGLGLAIIALTLTVRLSMIKQTAAQQNMQQGMTDMQPRMQEIQDKYKDDPVKMQQEMMKILKTSGKGPLKGCLMMLIQIPVFIGLFYVIKFSSTGETHIGNAYSFLQNLADRFFVLAEGGKTLVFNLKDIHTSFLGMDLLATGKDFDTTLNQNFFLAIFAGIFTFFQMKLTNLVKPATPQQKGPNGQAMPDMSKMMRFMGIFMAFMIGSFVYSMQLAIGLYIATTSFFGTAQYSITYRKLLKAKLLAFMNGKKGKPEIIENKK